jgi:transcriptional regulator with XRE-family HTH domain
MVLDDPADLHRHAVDAADRRRELAEFLRRRRERVAPEDVGLARGSRRRTPGLRREEVAQIAGVGVTWYTWLEQGRPVSPSASVLEAVSRALRLDAAECDHLHRLAGTIAPTDDRAAVRLDPEIQVIVDGLVPYPASVVNARFDVLAWNAAYAELFPGLVNAPPEERNVLWHLLTWTGPSVLIDQQDHDLRRMVAMLRAAFGRHVGEPTWIAFVNRLEAASPTFADLWARHEVAEPDNRLKRIRALSGENLGFFATSLGVTGQPEVRMTVYTPTDAATADYLRRRPTPVIEPMSVRPAPAKVTLGAGTPDVRVGPRPDDPSGQPES